MSGDVGSSECSHFLLDGINGFLTEANDAMFRGRAYSRARSFTFTGRLAPEQSERPFLFSKLVTTDSEDLACTDEQVIENLGTLQLRYRRGTNCRQSTVNLELLYKPSRHSSQWSSTTVRAIFCKSTDSPAPSPEPSPAPAQSVSVSPAPVQAQASNSPVATNSGPHRRSSSSVQPSRGSQARTAERERLAQLEAELESLERQERIATLRREINGLRGELGASANAGSSSANRKTKAEPLDEQTEAKKVKREVGGQSFSTSTSSAKGKGKGKGKAEVIELSDSD
ncbi:uncharacterized protein JCM6883_007548 [Sporobolomyces salmoneus]|uniref:uncharacterized protein n=1 Tax=Sporobolomyces salmoneus TaxID=183962 RepID=UPI003175E53E